MNREDTNKLGRAMRDPDHWVVRIIYTGDDGITTRRIVSPTSYRGMHAVRALCFAREEIRLFNLSNIHSVELIEAHTVMMPMELEVITTPEQLQPKA
jgi:predicted DNA-binding transcriptional regulator YafY